MKQTRDARQLGHKSGRNERRLREDMRNYFVQAPVEPFDRAGVLVATIGTILFVCGTLVCTFYYDDLEAAGHGWYFWVAVTGIIIGLMFTSWTLRRRRAMERAASHESAKSE